MAMKRKGEVEGQLTIDFFGDEESPRNDASSVGKPVAQTQDADLSLAISRDRSLFRFLCFGSGSSGNSCYVGSKRGGVIIDAGVDPDKVIDALKENGIPPSHVATVLLTHDHSDHVRYVYKYMRAFPHVSLMCTNRVLTGILRRHSISKRLKDYHRPIFKEIPFKISDFEITAFEVPHDGTDNMGFSITLGEKNFVLATDLGAVTSRARHYMTQADFLVIEANYDDRMLTVGPYPQFLKARIRTDNGHMDNVDTGRFLTEIAGGRLRNVFLCHLSHNNNLPEIALATVRKALETTGVSVGDASESIEDRACKLHLCALPRLTPSRLFVLR